MSKSYNYMFEASQDKRSQRVDESNELRRQRKSDAINKKRAALEKEDQGTNNSFAEAKTKLNSTSLTEIYEGAYLCRTTLSVEENPPIEEVIDSGILAKIVKMLDTSFYEDFTNSKLISKIRIEAAWILTNIASGSSAQTRFVVNLGAVPKLVSMLNESDLAVIDQAVWALGNIAGDCEEMRDLIIGEGALSVVIKHLSTFEDHIKMMRNLSWLLSNLNRGRSPSPQLVDMQRSFEVVQHIVLMDDTDIVADSFWCLSYMADVSKEMARAIVANENIMKRMIDLIRHFSSSLENNDHIHALARIGACAIAPMVRLIGNICTMTDDVTDAIINCGVIKYLPTIFYNYKNQKCPRIRKEIVFLLSNITCGPPNHVAYVVESNLINLTADALANYESYVRREAVYVVTNIFHAAKDNSSYLKSLMDADVLRSLFEYLTSVTNDAKILSVILDAVRFALVAGQNYEKETGVNPIKSEMDKEGYTDLVEDLQDIKDEEVVQKAGDIIAHFFGGEVGYE